MEPTDYTSTAHDQVENTIRLNLSKGLEKFDGISRRVNDFHDAVVREHQQLTGDDTSKLLSIEHHSDLDSVPEIAQHFELELSFTNGVNQVLGQLEDLAKKIRTERSEFRTGWHSIDVTDPQALSEIAQRRVDYDNALDTIVTEWILVVSKYKELGRSPHVEEVRDVRGDGEES